MADPTLKDLVARLDRMESLLGRLPGPITDPPPDPWGGWFPRNPFPSFAPVPSFPRVPFPFPNPGDPGPIDLSRLTKAQLAVSKEMLKTERFRLDAMEKLIDDHIKTVK
jgi:hypothetical protein